jgi:peptidoglycan/LPS O-acetylase OafA/YrhL
MPEALGRERSRIQFLDGLRGLAILLVICFHAYARYPDLMPFGNRYADIFVFRHGGIGVQLFFLISGFVIFLTLEKSRGFFDFMMRRWLRLFPAMLICSLIVYVFFAFIAENAHRSVSLRSLLPGLSFIEPHVWQAVLRSPQTMLEGSFWSLFVEVRFYAFAGALYFLVGETGAIAGIILMFMVTVAYASLQHLLPGGNWRIFEIYKGWTSAEHFGWFAAGALYFRYFQTRVRQLFIMATLLAVLAAVTTGGALPGKTCAALLVVFLFASVVYHSRLHQLLGNRVFLFLGAISYPLYLLHENIMVHMILKLGKLAPQIPGVLLPLLPIAGVIVIGAAVAIYVEPWLTDVIRPCYKRARLLLHIDQWWMPLAPVAEDLKPPPAPLP